VKDEKRPASNGVLVDVKERDVHAKKRSD